MATENQLAFFKSLYDEETAREKQLQDYAKHNLSLSTFYSAFIIFVVEKLRPDSMLSKSVFITAVAFMLAPFLWSLRAIKISTYEAIAEPRHIINEFGDTPPTDEEFFDDRIADYTVAYERNSKVNDGKAFRLSIAGYCLALGICLHACYFILRTA